MQFQSLILAASLATSALTASTPKPPQYCEMVQKPTTPKGAACGQYGHVKKPAVLKKLVTITTDPQECQEACFSNANCLAYARDYDKNCILYKKSVRDMGGMAQPCSGEGTGCPRDYYVTDRTCYAKKCTPAFTLRATGSTDNAEIYNDKIIYVDQGPDMPAVSGVTRFTDPSDTTGHYFGLSSAYGTLVSLTGNAWVATFGPVPRNDKMQWASRQYLRQNGWSWLQCSMDDTTKELKCGISLREEYQDRFHVCNSTQLLHIGEETYPDSGYEGCEGPVSLTAIYPVVSGPGRI